MDLPKIPIYKIKEKIWLWNGKGAWHFVTIPLKTAEEIKAMFGYLKAGWGSLPVKITIGKSTWQTSIFPDSKSGGYLIPIKGEIRKKEKLAEGDLVEVEIKVRV